MGIPEDKANEIIQAIKSEEEGALDALGVNDNGPITEGVLGFIEKWGVSDRVAKRVKKGGLDKIDMISGISDALNGISGVFSGVKQNKLNSDQIKVMYADYKKAVQPLLDKVGAEITLANPGDEFNQQLHEMDSAKPVSGVKRGRIIQTKVPGFNYEGETRLIKVIVAK